MQLDKVNKARDEFKLQKLNASISSQRSYQTSPIKLSSLSFASRSVANPVPNANSKKKEYKPSKVTETKKSSMFEVSDLSCYFSVSDIKIKAELHKALKKVGMVVQYEVSLVLNC